MGLPWLDFGVVEPLGFPEREFGVRKPPWLVTSGAALCPPGLGFAVPRLSFGVWWLGFELQGFQKGFPKPRPEPTARTAVRGRREAPSVAATAVVAAAAAAAAIAVAAAVATILLCLWLLGTGQACFRDCHARL